ncbi:carbonic anhydrase [Gymnopus androsaceus JB14]|uniref:Carbonic anhydrase n=1 Tax=Gymnopus androsaceus JB14 TaxID=1447944 RepID=A0A6A4HQ02_9AGAR|nr:carbonic anhydrase [Gymnopus androsaceus JB14]
MPLRHLAYSLYACNSNAFNLIRHCSSNATSTTTTNSASSPPIALPPTKRLAILTCMDARINPFEQLGIKPGEAHIIRNAGGMARDALRSLIISQRLLGTREIAVYHHTGCGMATFTTPYLRQLVKDSDPLNQEVAQMVDGIDFLDWPDLVGTDVDVTAAGVDSRVAKTDSKVGVTANVESTPESGILVPSDADSSIARLYQSVRSDVRFLQTNPLVLKGTKVTGWVHWVETGQATRVI